VRGATLEPFSAPTDHEATRVPEGANDTALMTNVKIDPIMGGTGMRSNFVTFITGEA